MKALKKITYFLGVVMPVIAFLAIFITFMITIISRYVFKTPVPWSYEISVLGYMYCMFFGVGKAMETDEHVVFSLVYDEVSPKMKCIFRIVYNLFLLALLIVCFVPCCISLTKMRMKTGVLMIPYKIVFAPFIYMLVEIMIRTILNVCQALKEMKNLKGGTGA